jgi:hypothetical protein
MEDEIAKELFNRFSKPGDKLDEDWIEAMEESIEDEGEIVASRHWVSGGPGIGASVDLIYRFRGHFLAWTDMGFDGPFESLGEATEAVNLVVVNEKGSKGVDCGG